MKFFFLLLIILTSCRTTTLKLKSELFAHRTGENSQWSDMSPWLPTNLKIKIKDPKFLCKNSVLKIKGKHNQTFTLYKESVDSTRDEKGYLNLRINAKDKDGSNCYVIFMQKEKNVIMVIYYSNLNLFYDVTE